MQQLNNIQEKFAIMINNYKLFRREYKKYKEVTHKFELMGQQKLDFEASMEELKSKMNVQDYEAKINKLEDNIYKMCKTIDKNKMYTNLFSADIDFDFIKSLGLDFSVCPDSRDTGIFYNFYIDNKMAFSKFELRAVDNNNYNEMYGV
jgi:hypothetical protein